MSKSNKEFLILLGMIMFCFWSGFLTKSLVGNLYTSETDINLTGLTTQAGIKNAKRFRIEYSSVMDSFDIYTSVRLRPGVDIDYHAEGRTIEDSIKHLSTLVIECKPNCTEGK